MLSDKSSSQQDPSNSGFALGAIMENVEPLGLPSRSNLLLGLKVSTVVGAVLVFFFQDLAIVTNDALKSEFTSHILAIPFLFAYLLYRKRKILGAAVRLETQNQLKGRRRLPTVAGALLSITATLLYWHGSYTFTPLEYHLSVLPIFTAGLALVLFNTQTLRQLAFPLAFLTFLTPPPSEVLFVLGSTLSVISSEASYRIASLLGIPSTLTSEYGNPIVRIARPDGTIVSFAVDIACSGIYSLIGFIVFAVFIAYMIRDGPHKKLAVFLIGLSLIYTLNILRITTILIIGYHYGEETSLQLFHLLGGWFLISMGTLLLLAFSEQVLRVKIFAKTAQECRGFDPTPERKESFCLKCGRILVPDDMRFDRLVALKMAAIIVGTILLMSVQTPVFALTEGPAEIIVQTPTGEQGNTHLLPQIEGYTLQYAYRDRNFEEISRQDASLVYVYLPLDETRETIWVAVEIGSATSMLHRWEVCLISWRIRHELPALVTRLDLRDIQIQENPPIIARYFAFQWAKTNRTQVVLYWFEDAIFMTNSTPQQKTVKMSAIAYPETPEGVTEADLSLVATTIAEHWQPIKRWSTLVIGIARHGAYFAGASAISLVAVVAFLYIEHINRKKGNIKIFSKLVPEEKFIVGAVNRASRDPPTLKNIALRYEESTGESIGLSVVLSKLREACEAGLVKEDLAAIGDEPFLIWRSQVPL